MITFTTAVTQRSLYMAFNNLIIRYYSTTTTTPLYSEITGLTIGTAAMPIRLYPDPNGWFFFNFRPYVAALINRNNFEDTVQPQIDAANADTFVYYVSNRVFLQRLVQIKVYLPGVETPETHTVTLSWLAGVQQLGDPFEYVVSNTYVLSPFMAGTANSYYLKYWQGYPFDIPFYASITGLTLKNETNLLQQEFPSLGAYGTRLFVSDGRTDESLEDLLPLAVGYNRLRIKRYEEDTDKDPFIHLEKMPYKCGIYLKWLNAQGGYSYWLFEDTYSIDRATKSLGELDRDNNNLGDTFARTTQIGKESIDTLKVVAELLTENESRIVQGILDSPKIYLFTGKPYSQSSYRHWVEVSLKTTSARIKNPREPLTNFMFDIELPVRYAQTL
ncbi:hypothetical protein AM493_13920 [Flavobacterium akiainvivens]|uniref:Uncharacterized protein n=1 Tax=Flavobacterium akiainvivens TaxID=1202724 RepID=A0A0M8MJD0_9FLAO|nr:hypothetical protein [Flavobacterium akiainvivens]KOS07007.1 hypothetical protein AM493_13920 [Flavobacterium akiainvivens]SFQ59273.1 hypothetical protein SAMN05444144_10993 [Flavobacterium akiainvivens]